MYSMKCFGLEKIKMWISSWWMYSFMLHFMVNVIVDGVLCCVLFFSGQEFEQGGGSGAPGFVRGQPSH